MEEENELNLPKEESNRKGINWNTLFLIAGITLGICLLVNHVFLSEYVSEKRCLTCEEWDKSEFQYVNLNTCEGKDINNQMIQLRCQEQIGVEVLRGTR